MNRLLLFITGFCAAALLPTMGFAASSDWFEAEGARVRLVTSGKPDRAGLLRGALDIDLKPGWKTYWRDPGQAGVPPTIDISASTNISGAAFDFPAPERHDEGKFAWAGYGHPVALPVTFTIADPGKGAVINANVFLGVCEAICVPVSTIFIIDTGSDAADSADEALVSAAFEALPAAAHSGFRLGEAKVSGQTATFEAEMPVGEKAVDLFLAAADGYFFATPKKIEKNGKVFFEVAVTRPETTPTAGAIHYTLVGDTGSVSGTLPYF